MILRSAEMELDSTSGCGEPSGLDDATLVGMSRDGDVAAFAELFRRHHAVAVRIAARTTRSLDAEDVAAEAFARVWGALVRGKGPDRAFRPYLAAAVRNIAVNGARVARELPTDPALFGDALLENTTAIAIAEADTVCVAFASLPERWRHALWVTEIEERPVAELARSLGTSANAASALCLRAREGLKAAWLQAHVDRRDPDPECQWVLEHLGAHTRHRLPARQEARVETHLNDCERCSTTATRLAVIGETLKVAAVFAGSGASLLAAKTALAVTSGTAAATGTVLAFPPIAAHTTQLALGITAGAQALSALRAWAVRLVTVIPKSAAVAVVATGVVASAAAGFALAPVRHEPQPAALGVVSVPAAQPAPEPTPTGPTPRKTASRPTKPTAVATPPGTRSTRRVTASSPKAKESSPRTAIPRSPRPSHPGLVAPRPPGRIPIPTVPPPPHQR